MRRLFIVLIFLIASVWFGVTLMRHPSYLLIAYQPWMVQMPLWFALLSLLILFGVFYLLIDSIDRANFFFYRVRNWWKLRREHKAYSNTQRGITYLIEGRWKKAEKFLLAGLNQTTEPLINYLGAARAAQAQQAYDRRDEYIQKAYKVAPKEEVAVGIMQAELQMGQGQFEHAEATLQQLQQLSPNHPRVLFLLEKVYTHLGDWKQLQAAIPKLRKASVLTKEQESLFNKNLAIEVLKNTPFAHLEDLQHSWDGLPKAVRQNPDVVYAYALQLKRFNQTDAMEEIIRKTLKQHWHPGLVKLYSTLPFKNLNRQLVIMGAWLKMYGQQQETLLALGRVCAKIQLWGKAKDYFERCLELGPNPEASYDYGKLLEHLGNVEEALQIYKKGLIAEGNDPTVSKNVLPLSQIVNE